MNTVEKIKKLKEEKKAIILAHYYVDEEIQKIADYIGDSFYLAKVASQTEADRIVFAGVEFMGESAKILNPNKKVLMPDTFADCPMAHMITIKEIKEMREKYDDLAVVCYINSTAEIKQYADVCVTSSNAVKIVKALPQKNIFFIPDQNLGDFVRRQVPEKNVITNCGHCPRHTNITLEKLNDIANEFSKILKPANSKDISVKEENYKNNENDKTQSARKQQVLNELNKELNRIDQLENIQNDLDNQNTIQPTEININEKISDVNISNISNISNNSNIQKNKIDITDNMDDFD